MPNVLITGASRGIGRATADQLASAGWSVIAGVRSEADADAIRAAGNPRLAPIRLDITDPGDVARLDAELPATLDAVVNNAGVVVGGPVESLALDDVRRQLEINVIGQLAVTQAVLPRIRASKGRIVFVSSLSGRISSPMTGAYSASKFALEAMADALRLELRPWKIGVVLVEPAQTDTDMWATAGELLDTTVAALSPEHARLYAGHIEGQRKAIPASQKMAAPVQGAATTIEKALTARRAKARYVVGTVPRIMGTAALLMPTALRDRVLADSGGVPKRP